MIFTVQINVTSERWTFYNEHISDWEHQLTPLGVVPRYLLNAYTFILLSADSTEYVWKMTELITQVGFSG